MTTTMLRRLGWLLLALTLPVLSHTLSEAEGAQGAAAQGKSDVPQVGTVARWEAEQAEAIGQTQLHRHPHASGGAFVEARENVTLRFRFSVPPARGEDEGRVALRVYPIFWRNSPRTPPRFFPYPLPTLPGPDAVVALGNRVYFTAPASGQVGVVDASNGQLLGRIKVGGYLTDIVADAEQQRLFVADAWNGRVVAIDPESRRPGIVAEAKVPEARALELGQGRLLVASRSERQLVVLNARTLGREQAVSFPAPPLDCDVSTASKPAVTVRFEPVTVRLPDFAPLPTDRPDPGFSRRTTVEFGQRNLVGWKRFTATPQGLQVEALTGKGTERRVTPIAQGVPVALSQSGGRLLVATDKGVLVILDAVTEVVAGALPVTDRAFAIVVPDGDKAYATDAPNNRVRVIDLKNLKVTKEIPVPDEPVALESYKPVWWTEDESPQPQLFVACRKGNAAAIVTTADDSLLRTLPLAFAPAFVRVILPPDPSWWPNMSAERIAMELTPRLAIAPAPELLNMAESGLVKDNAPRDDISPTVTYRTSAAVNLADGSRVTVTADNAHTLRLVTQKDGKTVREQWLDISSVTDTQDTAPVVDCGAVKIANQPWHRNLWMTPDQNILLVADSPLSRGPERSEGQVESEEFWRWNAPTVSVEKGNQEAVVDVQVQPGVMLDAVGVERVLTGEMDWQIAAEGMAELPEKYRAVFYADEPVRLRISGRGLGPTSMPLHLAVRIGNYMGEEVLVRAWERRVEGGATWEQVIEPSLRDTGLFRLDATLRTPQGQDRKTFYFMRVPKLERPRLLTRHADNAFISEQVRRYPKLFERYTQWLRENLNTPGFLPTSLVASEFLPQLPPEQQKLAQGGRWRRYDFAWRLIALEFAATFLDDREKEQLRQQVLQRFKSGRTDGYCHFHHHGPFFPGAAATLVDLVAADIGENAAEVQQMRQFLASRLGDMNVFAWTLAAMGDPPSLRERMLLFHLMSWLVNVEHYFTVHAGKRGGTWWLNQRTACHCPFGAYSFAFFYLRNFLGEDRFHDRTFVRGFLTHALLSRPLNDKRKLLGPPGPPGEPQRWITASLSRHPLMKRLYRFPISDFGSSSSIHNPQSVGWSELVEQLNGGGELTREQLQRAFAFPTSAANNSPVPFVLPLGLATGWFDPNVPEVDLSELPPTVLFDGEGEVAMRSDYGADATEVFFACGVRDHVYRHQPTNLMVWKAGEPLLGTASLHGDHGCPTLRISRGNSWGNVVVIEPSNWRTRWKHNYSHPRGEELAIINRFSDTTFRYLTRDQRLAGFTPAEGGFGGGLDLHGHTQSFFLREGHITAFETHPTFDYVAGDATLSWLPSQARFVGRQVLFVRPNWLVVYDRVELGAEGQRADWQAATGLELKVLGGRFVARSGEAQLDGWVVLPQAATLEAHDPATSPKYRPLFDTQAVGQKVLEIHAPPGKRLVEFCVVMRVRSGAEPPGDGRRSVPEVTPQMTDSHAGVLIRDGERTLGVRFARSEVQGGDLTLTDGKTKTEHRFVDRVDDTYRHWQSDPRYEHWMTERRFDFIVGEKP